MVAFLKDEVKKERERGDRLEEALLKPNTVIEVNPGINAAPVIPGRRTWSEIRLDLENRHRNPKPEAKVVDESIEELEQEVL